MRKVGNASLLLVGIALVGCGAASPAAKDASPPRSGSYASPVAEAAYGSSAGAPAAYAQPSGPPPTPASPGAVVATSPRVPPPEARPDSAPIAKTDAPIARPARPVVLPRAGQLTAGVWDDNRNFDFWKPFATKMIQANPSDNELFSEVEQNAARSASAQVKPHTELDVQLVLDTTGSMGDELSYLQGEFDAIAAQLRERFPQVTPRWSLVVYRDHGDAYVTRDFDFTSDTTRFRRDLRAQAAGGGGDTPEAVVEGLAHGMAQSWRTQDTNVAKMAFWVADAPAHPGEGRKLAEVVRIAKAKGVHVYPIASSDTDPTAEYQMRSAAQMTSGRYMFLTDDSGVGNSHAEPHIPCYNVTRLDHAIVRMIEVELSGKYVEAEPQKVVRRVGGPDKDGRCKTSSGMLVASF